jgi:broad specificity phosphatase PhoE
VRPARPTPASLVLLRHAEPAEARERCAGQGAFDPGLRSVGREQAAAAALRLGGEFDLVVSSPARRAMETAAAWDLPIEVDQRLAERCFGEWEGRRWVDLWPEVPPEVFSSPAAYAAFTPPGAEPYEAVLDRVQDAMEDLGAVPGRRVLVATHAGPLRLAVGAALGLSPAVALTLGADLARAAALDRYPDRWVLQSLNA